jgi:hypothetical protein
VDIGNNSLVIADYCIRVAGVFLGGPWFYLYRTLREGHALLTHTLGAGRVVVFDSMAM